MNSSCRCLFLDDWLPDAGSADLTADALQTQVVHVSLVPEIFTCSFDIIDCPLQVIWASSGERQGRLTDGCGNSAALARCTMPSITYTVQGGTPVTLRLSCVISQEPTNEPDNRPRFSLCFTGLRGEGAPGPSQLKFGLRPMCCHCSSNAVAPGYKYPHNITSKLEKIKPYIPHVCKASSLSFPTKSQTILDFLEKL